MPSRRTAGAAVAPQPSQACGRLRGRVLCSDSAPQQRASPSVVAVPLGRTALLLFTCAQSDVMKRGMEKWSQLEDSLIDQVRSQPILYNRNAKSYKHMLIKENKWRDIAASLGITRRDCKLKWKGIRDGYRRNKILENNGKVNRKSKYGDDRLKFLGNTAKKKDGDNIKEEQTDDEDNFQQCLPRDEKPQIPPSQSPPTPHMEQMVAMSYEKEVLLEELRKGREERYELMRFLSTVSLQQGASESITHSFFKSMADVVVQFPPHRIAEVRMRVCNLVSETEIQVMSEASPGEQVEVSLTTDCARTFKKTEFITPEIPLFDGIRR